MSEEDLPKPPRYPDHSQILEWRDDQGEVHPVKSVADWMHRKDHLRLGMQELMGRLPGERYPLNVRVLQSTETPKYVRHRIEYQSEPAGVVPAYLLAPTGLRGPAPGMMCLHQTVQIGKEEPCGLRGNPNLHYAHELAELGYVCLVPDYPTLGEYAYDFDADKHPSGSMKGIINHMAGVDLLCQWPEVDPSRIGSIGHSLGGHNTMFLAAFDERVRAMVSCCGFTAFCRYYGGDLTGWSGPRYCPRIKRYATCSDVPFDYHEMVASFAPRAFLAVAPIDDSNFDNQGVREVIDAARAVYELYGAPDNLVARYPDAKHDFPPEDRRAAYAFLGKHLQPAPAAKP